MLDSLLKKVKESKYSWWKWLLGIFIGLLFTVAIWKIMRLANKIVRLSAEKALFEEKVKDLKMQHEIEQNGAVKRALQAEIDATEKDITVRHATLEQLRKETQEAQEVVNRAKEWKELEKQARGEKQ